MTKTQWEWTEAAVAGLLISTALLVLLKTLVRLSGGWDCE